MTGKAYDQHDYVPQKRRALKALDEELKQVVSGVGDGASNVVRITTRVSQ